MLPLVCALHLFGGVSALLRLGLAERQISSNPFRKVKGNSKNILLLLSL